MGEPDRKSVLAECRCFLEARRAAYVSELESLDAAAAEETKSSAGDKYETGREMIGQARSVVERNLAEAESSLGILERMASAPGRGAVGFGSLVRTGIGWYLVGVSMGEVEVEGVKVQTTSFASPLGRTLSGKSSGDSFPWRGEETGVFDVLA